MKSNWKSGKAGISTANPNPLSKYLLDTNICIYFLKGLYDLHTKIQKAGPEHCYLSEISVAELKFGAANSGHPALNTRVVEDFIRQFPILPIYSALKVYASEKVRLRKKGIPLDEFDMLVGATALVNGLVLVTRNVSDFERIKGLSVENWAQD